MKQATKRLEYNAEAIKKRDKILTFVHDKNKDAFESWLLTTFRNYLNNRTKEENGASFMSYNEYIWREADEYYPTLMAYYDQTVDALKCADAIRRLRKTYYESTGMMVHEPEPSDSAVVTATGFWEKLNRMLN